jgi:hypothetical protein
MVKLQPKFIKQTDLETGEISKFKQEDLQNENSKFSYFAGNFFQFYKTGLTYMLSLNLNGSQLNFILFALTKIEKNTGRVNLNPTEAIQILGSKSTFFRVRNELLKLNILIKKEGDFYLNNRIFWSGDKEKLHDERINTPHLTLVKS